MDVLLNVLHYCHMILEWGHVERFFFQNKNKKVTLREFCSALENLIGKNVTGESCSDQFTVRPILYFSYNGQTSQDHPDSAYSHYYTSLGNIQNTVVAIGSWSPSNNKVELFDIATNTWTSKEPFPYAEK